MSANGFIPNLNDSVPDLIIGPGHHLCRKSSGGKKPPCGSTWNKALSLHTSSHNVTVFKNGNGRKNCQLLGKEQKRLLRLVDLLEII